MGLINDILHSNATPKMAQKALDIYAQRSLLITSNIANAETPGYKAVDIKPFESALKDAMESKAPMLKTNEKHLSGPMENIQNFQPEIEVSNEPGRLDGNNVNLDKEMAGLAQTSLMYQTVLTARAKRGQIINETIDQSR